MGERKIFNLIEWLVFRVKGPGILGRNVPVNLNLPLRNFLTGKFPCKIQQMRAVNVAPFFFFLEIEDFSDAPETVMNSGL